MPPKPKQSKSTTKKTSSSAASGPSTAVKKAPPEQDGDTLPWPAVSLKKGLKVECILPDQIYVIDDLFTPQECEKWVEFGQTLELEAPKPPGKDEAERTNFRFQTYAPRFAESLYKSLLPHLSTATFSTPHPPAGLYPKIRIYDYPPTTFFGAHYDSSTLDPLTNLTSKWTLLIYLTGAPDVVGGETIFWTRPPNAKGRNGQSVAVGLVKGRAVLHKHGDDCLLHEGETVTRGHKWILRSDLMYDR